MLIIIVIVGFWLLRFIWTGLLGFIETISTLDTVLVIALISGAITIVGLIVNSYISIVAHRNKVATELRAKMEKPYSEFVSLIFGLVEYTKTSKSMSDAEIMERMIRFSKEVTLYGSNEVVKKWAEYKTSAANNLEPLESMVRLEDILFAIREDLGMKKRGMAKGDLLSLFINDVKEVLQDKKSLSQK